MNTNIRKINLEASSIEDAIRRVALELEIPESCIEAKVLSEGKGFLGIFGKKLQLEITVNPERIETENVKKENTKAENTKKESTKTESVKRESAKTENTKRESTKTENTKKESTKTENTKKESTKAENTKRESIDNKQEKPDDSDDNPGDSDDNTEARIKLINESKVFIDELIVRMGLNVTTQVTDNHFITIDGEDAAIVVGKYGDTLKATEYILNLCVRETKDIPRIRLDSDGYRERRTANLQRLAISAARKAAKRGIPIKLEAMASWERRIIHITLQDSSDVFTESIGESPERKVVIMPKVSHNEVKVRPRKRFRR